MSVSDVCDVGTVYERRCELVRRLTVGVLSDVDVSALASWSDEPFDDAVHEFLKLWAAAVSSCPDACPRHEERLDVFAYRCAVIDLWCKPCADYFALRAAAIAGGLETMLRSWIAGVPFADIVA